MLSPLQKLIFVCIMPSSQNSYSDNSKVDTCGKQDLQKTLSLSCSFFFLKNELLLRYSFILPAFQQLVGLNKSAMHMKVSWTLQIHSSSVDFPTYGTMYVCPMMRSVEDVGRSTNLISHDLSSPGQRPSSTRLER